MEAIAAVFVSSWLEILAESLQAGISGHGFRFCAISKREHKRFQYY